MKALLAMSLLLMPALHDHFVSICTLRANTVDQSLEVTWRMTTHDVEHALELRTGSTIKFDDENGAVLRDSLFGAFLLENIQVMRDGRSLPIQYLGHEMELETLFAYLRVHEVPTTRGLAVRNTLMLGVFADQANIVHLEDAAGTRTIVCQAGSEMQRLDRE